MFVRFRQQGRRLQASLAQTRRVVGKVQTEHIASLGSVGLDISIRERLTFWAKLPARLERLSNRIGSDDARPKIYGALHARIPMVTPDEQRTMQLENAEDDERMWDALRIWASRRSLGTKVWSRWPSSEWLRIWPHGGSRRARSRRLGNGSTDSITSTA